MPNGPQKVFNQSFSCLYPYVMDIDLDFQSGDETEIDFTALIQNGAIDYVSTIYADLRGKAYGLEFYSNICKQVVYCKPDAITYAPIFLSNVPVIAVKAVTASPGSLVPVIVSNIPFNPFVYGV